MAHGPLVLPIATVASTQALTTVTVTEDALTIARGQVEVETGGDMQTPLRPRDAKLYGYAISYQAVWLMPQVHPLSRHEVTSLSQDGASQSYPQMGGEIPGSVLGPMARRCLNRLSWMRSKAVASESPFADQRVNAFEMGFLTDTEGWEDRPWTPIDVPATDPNSWQPL